MSRYYNEGCCGCKSIGHWYRYKTNNESCTFKQVCEVRHNFYPFLFFFFVNIQPKFKIPISNSTHPAKNASTTANSGGLSIVYCNVSSAIKLVGPIDTSLIVPKNIYVKAPKLKRKNVPTMYIRKLGIILVTVLYTNRRMTNITQIEMAAQLKLHMQLPEELMLSLLLFQL